MQRTKMMSIARQERGVVSIFIVVFAAIFMTIITVSFLMIMMHDQQQAVQSDLSQNAYDSAMDGVTDAQRAIAACGQASVPSSLDCGQLNSGDCKTLSAVHITGPMQNIDGNNEYPIGTQVGGPSPLNQAYTCVTINSTPANYKANVSQDSPFVIPLKASIAETSLGFSWSAQNAPTVALANNDANGLLSLDAWTAAKYPPMMRLQLIHLSAGGSITYSDLNRQKAETAFLYPVKNILGNATPIDFTSDNRRMTTVGMTPLTGPGCSLGTAICHMVGCSSIGLCQATLNDSDNDGNVVDSNDPATTYLVITPLYSNAMVTLTLPTPTNYFKNLQAAVDSTGRANNLFRRVQARVDLIPHPVYPNAAVSLQGPLCKNFAVTTILSLPTSPDPTCN